MRLTIPIHHRLTGFLGAGKTTLLNRILSVGRFDPARSDIDVHDHVHSDGCSPACDHDGHGHRQANAFSAWSYETDRPISLEALRETVRKLPGGIYRAKAVYGAEAP